MSLFRCIPTSLQSNSCACRAGCPLCLDERMTLDMPVALRVVHSVLSTLCDSRPSPLLRLRRDPTPVFCRTAVSDGCLLDSRCHSSNLPIYFTRSFAPRMYLITSRCWKGSDTPVFLRCWYALVHVTGYSFTTTDLQRSIPVAPQDHLHDGSSCWVGSEAGSVPARRWGDNALQSAPNGSV